MGLKLTMEETNKKTKGVRCIFIYSSESNEFLEEISCLLF